MHPNGIYMYQPKRERREKVFTKSDLKTGMIVERRNGNVELVVDTDKHGIVFLSNNGYNKLEGTRDDLTDNHGKQWDIVAVYMPTHISGYSMLNIEKTSECELIWKRTETRKMTVAEVSKELGYEVEIVKG